MIKGNDGKDDEWVEKKLNKRVIIRECGEDNRGGKKGKKRKWYEKSKYIIKIFF